jgi:aminoglycoside phosphotransferase (APT) family kinase protein
MYLTATNLPDYLVGRGLIEFDALIDEGFAISEAGRRNRNFKVDRAGRTGLFVKQVSHTASLEPLATLQREVAFYATIRAALDLGEIAALIPRLIDYDPQRLCLVTELIGESESFGEFHMRRKDFSTEAADKLGRGLATYHSAPPAALAALAAARILPQQLPWFLTLDPYTLAPLGQFGAAGATLIEALRPFPALLSTLLTLRAHWVFDSLVHGDMKWDNLLIVEEDGCEPELRVVDWELADFGDAAWDAGAVLAAYIAFAMLPLSQGASATELPARFTDMRPALRSFWVRYAADRRLPASRAYLERCLVFAAARLALTVFEYLYALLQMNPALVAMLQAGESIAANPSRAAAEWMGL